MARVYAEEAQAAGSGNPWEGIPMMKPTLRLGSVGPAVEELQNALNKAASAFAKLVPDGAFGMKTHARVREFQGQRKLLADGIVGPLTWEVLKPLLAELEKVLPQIVPPPVGPPQAEEAGRKAVVDRALTQFMAFRWNGNVSPANPRIAGKLCADPLTRARQGGAHINEIFTLAGMNAQRCLKISKEAELMYQGPFSPHDRNNKDIVSWCGIFAVYVYKIARLNVSNWPLKYSLPWENEKASDEFRIVQHPQPGDIGIVDPVGGNNHHFVIVDINGSQVISIDGNAGMLMEIVKTTYTMQQIKNRQGYFLSAIWDRVAA